MKNKLCVALDVNTIAEAIQLVNCLSPYVGVFKIGSQLFTSEGPSIVEAVQKAGGNVFLDLKYHDIPNTVKEAALVALRMGVSMFNVHTLGGFNMMKTVADAVMEEAQKTYKTRPIILGVTILTSITEMELYDDLLVRFPLTEYIGHLASLAQKAGLDGIVCSPNEITTIRKRCGNGFILVTPGIRPAGNDANDQKRYTTPNEAVNIGADFIVVGRPIIAAKDPALAASNILDEITLYN